MLSLVLEGINGGNREPWVTPEQLSDCSNAQVDLGSVCDAATEILYLLSGRQFGVRTETIRPSASQSCWGFRDEDQSRGLRLRTPVREVLEVKLNGTVLDPAEYTTLSGLLFRTNGWAWPTWQRLERPDTEANTFSVTYSWGKDVPPGGRAAAELFACQLAKYVAREPCALPDRVLSTTRQGVSFTMLDPAQFAAENRTGLHLVDTWLGAVNPHGLRRRATVMGPDDVRRYRA